MAARRSPKSPAESEEPVSVRLEKSTLEAVRAQAQRTGKSVSRVIKEMLEMTLRTQKFPGIIFIDGPSGRRARLAGAGLDVWEVIALLQGYKTESRLRERFPQLTPLAIQVAKAYAEEYPEEIGAFLALNAQTPESLKQKVPWLEVVRS